MSDPQQKPTAMQYQEAGQQQVETTAYKEAKGKAVKAGTKERDGEL